MFESANVALPWKSTSGKESCFSGQTMLERGYKYAHWNLTSLFYHLLPEFKIVTQDPGTRSYDEESLLLYDTLWKLPTTNSVELFNWHPDCWLCRALPADQNWSESMGRNWMEATLRRNPSNWQISKFASTGTRCIYFSMPLCVLLGFDLVAWKLWFTS